MSMASPRSPLNCQILGQYLPLSPDSQRSRAGTSYLSSRSHPGIDPTEVQSYGRHEKQNYYQTPPHSYTDQSDDPSEQLLQMRPRDPTYYLAASQSPEETTKSLPSQRQGDYDVSMYGPGSTGLVDPYDSPGASNLGLGSPGVARRAKAHVPSACVNCKRKHLACETRRPCNRCLQAGKEATCVDVQHKKRGRPRLRDEDHCRGVNSTGDYSHPHLYPAQSDLLAQNAHPDQYRSGASYRELRPHADSYAREAQIGPPAPGQSSRHPYSSQSHAQLSSYGPKLIRDLSEVNPTALLTLDFVIVRCNASFRNALSLRSEAEDKRLKDLVLPSEKEKIQRLQGSLQTEMRSSGQTPFYKNSGDLYESIASFQSRSEYWTFRLPNGQSRGYPVSVSLAWTDSFFVVLTLVSNVNQVPPTISNPGHQNLWGTPASSLNAPQPGYNDHPFDSRTYQSYISNSANELLQPYHAENSLSRQRSPSNPQGSGSSPSTGSSGTTRSSLHGSDVPTESLRHLHLPPIRVSETSAPRAKDAREERVKPSSKAGQVSPGRDKRKKRRKVEIGDILR